MTKTKENSNRTYTCVFCKNTFKGFGNNPQPLKKGECCNECNATRVIPARLQLKKELVEDQNNRVEKECIVCGRVQELNFEDINTCCGYSMFVKYDLDLLRQVGWVKK